MHAGRPVTSPTLRAAVLVYRALWPWQRRLLAALMLAAVLASLAWRAWPAEAPHERPYSEISTRRAR